MFVVSQGKHFPKKTHTAALVLLCPLQQLPASVCCHCTAVYSNGGSPCKFLYFFLSPAQGSVVTVKYSVSLTGQLLLVNTHMLPAETCRPLGTLSADACGLDGFCGNSSFGCGDFGDLFMDLDRMANVASLSTAVTVSH